MARRTLTRLIERSIGTEWDRTVARLRGGGKRHLLLCWNRGLGDVALGLYPLVQALRGAVPDLTISVLTRAELAEAFLLLGVDELIVDPSLQRRSAVVVADSLRRLGIDATRFDRILKRPDPTRWLRDRARVQLRLAWPADCDRLAERFDAAFVARDAPSAPPLTIAVHVQSETTGFYGYRKDWPLDAWRAFFDALVARRDARFVLFGHVAEPAFTGPHVVDLRGRTTLFEMLAVIKNRCDVLVAPDSGVLTMTYYLDVQTPIDVVSLWADPRQGVLKQGMPSPNPLLRHRALVAPDERIERLAVATVVAAIDALRPPAR